VFDTQEIVDNPKKKFIGDKFGKQAYWIDFICTYNTIFKNILKIILNYSCIMGWTTVLLEINTPYIKRNILL